MNIWVLLSYLPGHQPRWQTPQDLIVTPPDSNEEAGLGWSNNFGILKSPHSFWRPPKNIEISQMFSSFSWGVGSSKIWDILEILKFIKFSWRSYWVMSESRDRRRFVNGMAESWKTCWGRMNRSKGTSSNTKRCSSAAISTRRETECKV